MKTLTCALLLACSLTIFGQSTAGNVEIGVTTLSNGAKYSPKHVLAVWVEDQAGNFVKTLKLNGDRRKQYLYTWNKNTSGNTVDAVTGATLRSHETHHLSWDCTNTSGAVVPDGNYSVKIEYTSAHAQGPIATINFLKSKNPQTVEPANLTHFRNMQLVYTAPESPTRAHEINEMLGRGMNLGNAFELPRTNDWGLHIKSDYLKIIAEKGFSHVRVPIRWSDYAGTDAPYTIEATFMDTIKKVVDAALDNKLLVIINMHNYDDFNDNPTGVHRTRFLAIWEQIAEDFKDYPDSLLFEFLNEPHQTMSETNWNEIFKQTLDTVRLTNPARICVVGPPDWNDVGSINKLVWPADTNMIMTVHYYNPIEFTHQGDTLAADNAESWLGTKWDSTEAQMQAIVNDFAEVWNFSETNNVPVYVGEFGTYSAADWISRRKWTSYCARTFEVFGFSWAYWEFGGGYGVYDPDLEIWRNHLLNALTEQVDENSNTILVESIVVDQNSLVIDTKEGSLQLEAGVLPLDASNADLSWEIKSGADLATISSSGLLTAKGIADGEVIVKISAVDGSGMFTEVTISIVNQVLIESVEINEQDALKIFVSNKKLYYELPASNENREVLLMNIDGKLIYRKEFPAFSTKGDFDVKALTSGIYMAIVKDSKGFISRKAVIF